jgi:hypothetical protein
MGLSSRYESASRIRSSSANVVFNFVFTRPLMVNLQVCAEVRSGRVVSIGVPKRKWVRRGRVAFLDHLLEQSSGAAPQGDPPPHRRRRRLPRSGCPDRLVGAPVNLASRVTGLAPAGTALITETTRSAIGDGGGFSWSFEKAKHLRGIAGKVRLFRASKYPNQ